MTKFSLVQKIQQSHLLDDISRSCEPTGAIVGAQSTCHPLKRGGPVEALARP